MKTVVRDTEESTLDSLREFLDDYSHKYCGLRLSDYPNGDLFELPDNEYLQYCKMLLFLLPERTSYMAHKKKEYALLGAAIVNYHSELYLGSLPQAKTLQNISKAQLTVKNKLELKLFANSVKGYEKMIPGATALFTSFIRKCEIAQVSLGNIPKRLN